MAKVEIMAREKTKLLAKDDGTATPVRDNITTTSGTCSLRRKCVWIVVVFVVVYIGLIFDTQFHRKEQNFHLFPENFVWGAATSSYQIEGAADEDGRGVSIWDTYCQVEGNIADGSSGKIACDHYHRIDEDIKLMKQLGLKAYRFSISWPRIYPHGLGEINAAGLAFYNHLINTLLENEIEPWATLYHWDLPQALEDRYGGWLDAAIVHDFGNYARTCFEAFGDRVQHWITVNEPWTVAVQGYQDGTKAPGKTDNPTIDVYQAGHNLILAHARAASIYHNEFAPAQKGTIGIANSGDFRYPKTETQSDMDAAERAMVFQYAWFADPFFYGDYPREMRQILKDRLPNFTDTQRKEVIGSTDFLGLNHYSTLYAAEPKTQPTYGGYWADMNVEFSSDPSWPKNFMGWSLNSTGCKELLIWLSNRYEGIPLVMTENGTSEDEPDLATALQDDGRREFLEGYLRACAEAIELGVILRGYFAWSLLDNFEWEYGYTRRFGICFVDFETQTRTPKSSALWYSKVIRSNGQSIKRL